MQNIAKFTHKGKSIKLWLNFLLGVYSAVCCQPVSIVLRST